MKIVMFISRKQNNVTEAVKDLIYRAPSTKKT